MSDNKTGNGTEKAGLIAEIMNKARGIDFGFLNRFNIGQLQDYFNRLSSINPADQIVELVDVGD